MRQNVFVVEHPLVQHKLAYLRQRKTAPKEFRSLMEEITVLLLYEATRTLHQVEVEIETPMCRGSGRTISGKKIAFIGILRAGLGMLPGAMRLVPGAKVGHVGIYRDSFSLQPVEYYCKFPRGLEQADCIVFDPLLATGGTAIEAVNMLKQSAPSSIKLISLIGAREGLNAFVHSHPEVEVYLASEDARLDANGYILPGLGDAGDRLFETY